MNDDIYWEAQWVIGELEEARGGMFMCEAAEDCLDVLLQLKR